MRKNIGGRKVARDIGIRQRGGNDQHGEHDGEDHSHAQQNTACARRPLVLTVEPAFAAGTENGGKFLHIRSFTTE